jgi:hypothetical protein
MDEITCSVYVGSGYVVCDVTVGFWKDSKVVTIKPRQDDMEKITLSFGKEDIINLIKKLL